MYVCTLKDKIELAVSPVFRLSAAVKNDKVSIFHRNKYYHSLLLGNIKFSLPGLQSVYLGDIFRLKQYVFRNFKRK